MITRIKKSLTYIPSSLSEAIAYLTSIGSKQRDINSVRSEAKAKIEAINADAKKTIEVLTKDRDAFFTSLFTFSSAHKKELTKDTRSQKTSEGTFGWRWTTPYVDIAEGVSDEKIIATMKRKGLTDYIRIIEELDREAMLRDRPEVPGVSYSQRDEFFAKPKLAREDGRAEELVKTEAIDV